MLKRLEPSSREQETLWAADIETDKFGILLYVNSYNGVEYRTFKTWAGWIAYLRDETLAGRGGRIWIHNGGRFDAVNLYNRIVRGDRLGGSIRGGSVGRMSGPTIIELVLKVGPALEDITEFENEADEERSARREDAALFKIHKERGGNSKSAFKRRARRARVLEQKLELIGKPELPPLPPGSKVVTLRLADSARLMPMPLADLAGKKGFGLDVGKGDVPKAYKSDMGRYLLDKPEAFHEYHKRDTLILHEVIRRFWLLLNEISPIGNLPLTLASTSMKVFRTSFFDHNIITPPRLERDFTRLAYQGGRCEFFGDGVEVAGQRCTFDDVWIYDINSQYPSVMRDGLFPTYKGFYTEKEHEARGADGRILPGCYHVRYEQRHGRYAILKPRLPDGSVAAEASFSGETYCTYLELNEIEKYGGLVQIIDGYVYQDMQPIFKRFVTELYGRRKQAERDGNAALKYVVKILLNSLYGKFGIKEDGERIADLTQAEIEKLSEKDEPPIIQPIEDAEGFFTIKEPIKAEYCFPAIAAFVTAEARLMILRLGNDHGVRLLYADTDSAHVQPSARYPHGIPDSLVDPDTLGAFKREAVGIRVVYGGRKVYVTPDKIKLKGMPEGALEKVALIQAIITNSPIEGVFSSPSSIKSAIRDKNDSPNRFDQHVRTFTPDVSSKTKGLLR